MRLRHPRHLRRAWRHRPRKLPSPTGGPPLEVSFRDGWPTPSTLVLFLPDDDYATCCTNMYDQWCPNSDVFHTAEDAKAWANARKLTGSVLTLPEAATLGATRWRPLAADPRQ